MFLLLHLLCWNLFQPASVWKGSKLQGSLVALKLYQSAEDQILWDQRSQLAICELEHQITWCLTWVWTKTSCSNMFNILVPYINIFLNHPIPAPEWISTRGRNLPPLDLAQSDISRRLFACWMAIHLRHKRGSPGRVRNPWAKRPHPTKSLRKNMEKPENVLNFEFLRPCC